MDFSQRQWLGTSRWVPKSITHCLVVLIHPCSILQMPLGNFHRHDCRKQKRIAHCTKCSQTVCGLEPITFWNVCNHAFVSSFGSSFGSSCATKQNKNRGEVSVLSKPRRWLELPMCFATQSIVIWMFKFKTPAHHSQPGHQDTEKSTQCRHTFLT